MSDDWSQAAWSLTTAIQLGMWRITQIHVSQAEPDRAYFIFQMDHRDQFLFSHYFRMVYCQVAFGCLHVEGSEV